jgi:hypothetical protein
MRITPSVLTITIKDQVTYEADIYDPSQFATNPNITTPNTPRNFYAGTVIGDITLVNGEAVKGTYVGGLRPIIAKPNPVSGEAIADITRNSLREHVFEILKSDGTAIGSIMAAGFSGGVAPPGTVLPPGQTGNWAISGGTGLYLGVRGQVGAFGQGPAYSGRYASIAEDPGHRRQNGGFDNTFILHIIPMDPPEIMTTSFGPHIVHGNQHPVNLVHPAHSNEPLSLFASGLGPTHPDVDLTQPFPLNPPTVNSPLTVTVNGEHADIISAVGVPGLVNGYQVNFKMPASPGTGLVPIQLTVGWIAGPPANIWVA